MIFKGLKRTCLPVYLSVCLSVCLSSSFSPAGLTIQIGGEGDQENQWGWNFTVYKTRLIRRDSYLFGSIRKVRNKHSDCRAGLATMRHATHRSWKKVAATPSQNRISTKHLAVMQYCTFLGLGALSDCRNSCRICPPLLDFGYVVFL